MLNALNAPRALAFETVCIIGLGYIGLPLATVFASRGVKVLGVDINPLITATINKGQVHIAEPGLEELLERTVSAKQLEAFPTPQPADVYIIAVPTPFGDAHQPDLSYVFAAAESIAPFLNKGTLVVLESTSPVGTTEKMSQRLASLRPDLSFPHLDSEHADVNIAYSPERILPGNALRELVENDRTVGGISPTCTQRAMELYQLIVQGQCIPTQAKTAEMSKLAENAFRDVNIAFANEISLLCDKLDIDVWELIALTNRHPRVNILRPGPGVGGHCIAVDPWFLVWSCPEEAKLIRLAREVNKGKTDYVIQKVQDLSKALEYPPIACFGLAFKPNIDDLRESPAIDIVRHLAKANPQQTFLVVEPHITDLPSNLAEYTNVHLVSSQEALEDSKIALMLVSHTAFQIIPPSRLANHHVIDTPGVWAA